MQLVAYGAQDVYLTGNPQITFFKSVYRRHTNFSMECVIQDINGSVNYGHKLSTTISRNGDLISQIYINIKLDNAQDESSSNTKYAIPNNFGNFLFDYIDIDIGGQKIDRLYGHYMELWARLTEKNNGGNVGVYSTHMQTPLTKYQQLSGSGGVYYLEGSSAETWNSYSNYYKIKEQENNIPQRLIVPLPFWFCRFPGLSIPLIALQYHEVKLKIQLKTEQELHHGEVFNVNKKDDGSNDYHFKLPDIKDNLELWIDYIYLDTDERRRFAQVPHEYLIEQVQRYEKTVDLKSIPNATHEIADFTADLNFNHPIKELIFSWDWDYNGCLPGLGDVKSNITLKLNGLDRFQADMPLYYFTRTQNWKYHDAICNLYGTTFIENTDGLRIGNEPTPQDGLNDDYPIYDSIGIYSFALKPEEHQPSGSCNFSRIDSAKLYFKKLKGTQQDEHHSVVGAAQNLMIYARNYNILRIMSGMGGLAYSN